MADGRPQMAGSIKPDATVICELVDEHHIELHHPGKREFAMPFRFESLTIWHLAREFTGLVHERVTSLPRSEQYGLASQINRAADAIVLLTAEGSGLPTRTLFRHRLGLAQGEIAEAAAASFLVLDRSYFNQATPKEIYDAAQSGLPNQCLP